MAPPIHPNARLIELAGAVVAQASRDAKNSQKAREWITDTCPALADACPQRVAQGIGRVGVSSGNVRLGLAESRPGRRKRAST